MVRLSTAVVFALVAATAVLAMHEDEQGKFDWAKFNIGVPSHAVFHPASKTTKQIYAVTDKNVVAALRLKDGEIRWRRVFGSSEEDRFVCVAAAKSIVVAATKSRIESFSPLTGVSLRTTPVDDEQEVIGCGSVGDAIFVAVTYHADKKNAVAIVLVDGDEETTVTKEKALAKGPVVGAAFAGNRLVIQEEKGKGSVFAIDAEKGSLTFLETVSLSGESPVAVSGGSVTTTTTCLDIAPTKEQQSAAVVFEDKTEVSFKCESSSAKAQKVTASDKSGDYTVELNGHSTSISSAVGARLLATQCASDDTTVRMVLVKATGDLSFVDMRKGGKEVHSSWTRFEGITSPTQVIFEEHTHSRGDKFGLSQMLFTVSERHGLYALPSHESGSIKYSKDLNIELNKGEKEYVATSKISINRDMLEVRLQSNKGTVVVIDYDAAHGVELKRRTESGEAAKVLLSFPTDGSLISEGNKVTAPSTPTEEEKKASKKAKQQTGKHYFIVDRSAGQFNGYTVEESASVPTWSITLGPLAALAANHDPHAIDTVEHYRAVPNTTSNVAEMRRRYPLSNVIVAAHFSKSGTLIVTAIEAITGNVIGTMRHSDARVSSSTSSQKSTTVPLVVAENVIVYHFYNSKRLRYYIGVWELFEHQDVHVTDAQFTSPPLIVSSFVSKRKTFSPQTTRLPNVLTAVFAFPMGAVSAMGVTTSAQGIARKQVLFASPQGSVMAVPLPQLFIGAMQQMAAQAPAATGGRKISADVIAVPSTSFLSHRHQILRPSLVVTSPTPLESTSHVVVAGLDWFYTRASAGKPFDILNDDFNQSGLLIVCVVLPVLCLLVRAFAQRRVVKLAWA